MSVCNYLAHTTSRLNMQGSTRSNFDLLKPYEQQLWRLGALAERYFTDDPNTRWRC